MSTQVKFIYKAHLKATSIDQSYLQREIKMHNISQKQDKPKFKNGVLTVSGKLKLFVKKFNIMGTQNQLQDLTLKDTLLHSLGAAVEKAVTLRFRLRALN